ncbi:PepSY domain-containing protein [Sphingobacterium sp. lm-10]|uniref:PepSY-associated TM helix domain-containing protein n=1 Tax=Sphingobacterium sp. lm-10 TaxID=2944904 RepID=UPI002020BA3B|nr:PepSY-associated TM helix domain-containing protein [Sphingobacterium sp. lm-10]MCL7987624.1 PepSY domain-containing protein [Sphingobacterium sp. lm-10]
MLKKGILWLHKWLGLFTGLVVFLVSLSGAIYTFHDELKLWAYPDKYFIVPMIDPKPLPLTELIGRAQEALPAGEEISRVDLYPDPGRSWVFRGSEINPAGFGHWNYFRYYKRVFLNPYTGECVAVEDSKNEFFQLILQLHMNLLLGKTYGHGIVAYSTLLFAVLLVTGMILWWPKKWRGKTLRRSIWLDRKAKWKRLNYDLHNVWGFYTFPVALILCITGLLFSFPACKEPYSAFFNRFSFVDTEVVVPRSATNKIAKIYDAPIDNLLAYALQQHPQAGMMSVRLRAPDAPIVDIQVRLEESRSGLFRWYYVHTADLTLSELRSHEDLAAGDLLSALNFDLHTGTIGGLSTKIVVFIIALGCASLPVTGYLVWWNKRTKRKVRKRV